MQLRNLHLFPANISKLGRTGRLEAVGTGTGRKQNEEGRWTREPQCHIVECASFHGDTLKVKIPLEPCEEFEKLEKIIRDGKTAVISFSGLTIKPYAMTTAAGTFLSGVSAKADGFQILEILDDEMEDFSIEE